MIVLLAFLALWGLYGFAVLRLGPRWKFIRYLPMVVGVLIATAPLWAIALMALLPSSCKVAASGPHPCFFLGLDVGGLLYQVGVFAMVGLFVIPLFAMAGGLYVAIHLPFFFAARRRDKAAHSHSLPAAAEPDYAGFWARTGASMIDTLLLTAITFPLLMLAKSSWDNQSTFSPAEFLISYVLPAALVIALWLWLSKTPGKMAIGATIVDADTGGKPTAGQFLIRYVGYLVSTLPLGLGLIWVGIDARKQGWHDKMAGTVVVRRGQAAF